MNILSGTSDFFGLDIGTTAIRLVHLRSSGSIKSLIKYAYVPVDSKLVMSDAKADQQKVAQIISDLIAKSQVSTRNVAVGLSSQKVFTTVFEIDRLSNSELAKAIRYQADSIIPTTIDDSKIDWVLLGDSPQDKTKLEILISSVTKKYVEQQLDLLENIGLNVIAFEPDTMALSRSLIVRGVPLPQMMLDIGSKSTDLVISMDQKPRLTRSIPVGNESIVRAAAQTLNIDYKQADQFVFKFGLSQDKLDGQVYQAIIGTVDTLISEIEKSIKFFESRYTDVKLERIIVTGGASSLPEFPVYLANKFNLNIEIGNAWRNISYDPSQQNDLLAVSNHFSVAAGLAERSL